MKIMYSMAYAYIDEGIKKGITQGVAQSMEQKTIEIATNMLKQGADINCVAKVTGCTTEQIIKIKSQL